MRKAEGSNDVLPRRPLAQAFPPSTSTRDDGRVASSSATPGVTAAQLAGIPADLGQYILQLETQNQELRVTLSAAQSGKHSLVADRGEDEKRMFLNDVLSQVETVIQAHKNKTAAEVQKYKTEAENATLALRNLRNAIQQEGMDLTLAPAMMSFSRKSKQQEKSGNAALELSMPPESQQLLDNIAEEYLQKLLAVNSSDEVPHVVRTTTKSAFEAVVMHFTDQLCRNFEESESVIQTLRTENSALQEEIRTQQHLNESQKVQLVQHAEMEAQALRDQLRSFQVAASSGDEVAAAVNERALEEYTHMLIEARREANHLRQELDQERNHCAQVCLRLKTSLQKRNNEFESAVVNRAEEVVKQHERKIAELERQLSEYTLTRGPRSVADRGVQAGEPSIVVPTHENFVPNVMSAVKRDPTRMNNPHNREMFEQEVWRKTQELLQKYGSSTA